MGRENDREGKHRSLKWSLAIPTSHGLSLPPGPQR
jgi:hypothetical protein